MGILDRSEGKNRKKWLIPLALLGALAAAIGIKRRRSKEVDESAS